MSDVPLLIAIVANETREVALAWIRENMTEPDGDLYQIVQDETDCKTCESPRMVRVERGNP